MNRRLDILTPHPPLKPVALKAIIPGELALRLHRLRLLRRTTNQETVIAALSAYLDTLERSTTPPHPDAQKAL